MSDKKIQELTLFSSPNQIERVEPYLLEIQSRGDIDEALFGKIQLAVNEAVTNAIIHGNEENESKKVSVNAQINNNEIEITVKDEGSGFNPSVLPNPTNEKQLLKQSGRGVFLIKQYADAVSFEKRGTQVRMKFNRK